AINKSFALGAKKNKILGHRQKTIHIVLNKIIKFTVYIIVICSILGVLGVNAGAIITSIGVVGLAVGLAVQDILKDVIAGLFILLESQYAIGDIIAIGNFRGEVISLDLRSTKLCNETGEIKILSNRNISDVINYSTRAVTLYFNLDLAYDNDDKKIDEIFNDLAQRLTKTITETKGEFKYLGIQKMTDKVTRSLSVEIDVKNSEIIKSQVWSEIKKTLDKNDVRR
ncbi:MAG: mechanosensitive ion channel domain-containing protein, partial [Bacilli bacterium]